MSVPYHCFLGVDLGWHGAVIDLAPECVRFFCERYGKLVKPARSIAVA